MVINSRDEKVDMAAFFNRLSRIKTIIIE